MKALEAFPTHGADVQVAAADPFGKERKPLFHLGKFDHPAVLRTHHFFVEVTGADESPLREQVPRWLKVSAAVAIVLGAVFAGLSLMLSRPRR